VRRSAEREAGNAEESLSFRCLASKEAEWSDAMRILEGVLIDYS